jgi:periplasmic copper chaperone A
VAVPRELPPVEPPRRLWALAFAGVLGGVAVVLVVVGLFVAGSGGHGSSASSEAKVRVTDAWTTPGQGLTAVYLTIANDGAADRLVDVTADGAGSALLMAANGQVAHNSTTGATAVDLAVPQGVTKLRPGARHLMLRDLTTSLEAGRSLPLHLRFDRAGKVTVQVDVLTPDEASARSG